MVYAQRQEAGYTSEVLTGNLVLPNLLRLGGAHIRSADGEYFE